MLLKLLLLFILVPFVELFLLLELAQYTSGLFALLTVIVTGVIGTTLAHHQGLRTIRAIERDVAEGRMPTGTLLDAALIFCAGALLLTPGLLTDAFGLSLLIPPVRRLYRAGIARWIRNRFQVQSFGTTDSEPPAHSRIIDAHVITRHEEDAEDQD